MKSTTINNLVVIDLSGTIMAVVTGMIADLQIKQKQFVLRKGE
jgi:hypothetical protein